MSIYTAANIYDLGLSSKLYPEHKFIYTQSINLCGDDRYIPKDTRNKLYRDSELLPAVHVGNIKNAKIIGDRLVIKDNMVLNCSFLNNRVVHEVAVKRAKGVNIDIDDKYLRDEYKCAFLKSAIWLCGQHGSYQHWFTEVLPLIWIYKSYVSDFTNTNIIVGHDIKDYQLDVLYRCGVKKENIVKKTRSQNLAIESLYVSDPLSINSFWVHPAVKKAYSFIFSMPEITKSEKKEQRKLILGRKKLAHTREILNYEGLVQRLVKKGFEVIYPEDLSFSSKMSTFSSASHVVSMTGGGLTSIIFCRPSTKISVIAPDVFPINTFRDLAAIYELNIRYYLSTSFVPVVGSVLNSNSFIADYIINDLERFNCD